MRKSGDQHHNWGGDEVGYSGAHRWLTDKHPKSGRCETCGREGKTEYAFLHHPQKHTRSRVDYRELCVRCHNRLDGGGVSDSSKCRLGHDDWYVRRNTRGFIERECRECRRIRRRKVAS